MKLTIEDVMALDALDSKIRMMLPEQYVDSYVDVQPISMGSAGLKFGADGRVAWDEIWATFCDLAMAGGPPHRGTLLQPASAADISSDPDNHARAVEEIGRGISMVTGLTAQPAEPGWIAVHCPSRGMAAWLVRAIVMENVLARHSADTLYLPVGPSFRLEKEIKNVVTVIAKTCHYWINHISPERQLEIESQLASDAHESELLEPASFDEIMSHLEDYETVVNRIVKELGEPLGLICFPRRYAGWIGIECPNVRTAVWLIRAIVVDNVLARREGELVFLPTNPVFSAGGRVDRLVNTFGRAWHLSKAARVQ